MFSSEALQRQTNNIKQSDLLTARDAKDMSFILPDMENKRISIHRFLFNAILFRMYSKKETYVDLEPFLAMLVSVHTILPIQPGLVCKTSSRSSTQLLRPSGEECLILPR